MDLGSFLIHFWWWQLVVYSICEQFKFRAKIIHLVKIAISFFPVFSGQVAFTSAPYVLIGPRALKMYWADLRAEDNVIQLSGFAKEGR
jgi:hypothetical protein